MQSMQSRLLLNSFPNFTFQWKPNKTYFLKPSLKNHFQILSQRKPDTFFNEPETLPVSVRNSSGDFSRYIWENGEIKLVCFDENSCSLWNFGLVIRNFFLPREFSGNYLEYVKWKCFHRVFSSALQVLATQAMFRAIGIGYSRSLPSAAALNWVLKDGLGRLCRCIYTASLASAFDTNLKRVRFLTSVVFSLSIGVELLTPAFPQYFLLLATVANIAKQISLGCYLATGTAVHRSFAVADNLGEVSAKGQIQTVCFDNFGLMLAAALNILLRNNSRLQIALPFIVYPIFSAMDLIGIYKGLKHVHLQTLTKDRLEIIINKWIKLGRVPSLAEVSEEEGIGLMQNKDKLLWPIRIGSLHPSRQMPRLSMMTMRTLKDEDFHFISLELVYSILARNRRQGIVLCMREASGTTHVIMGLLQACYIREAVLSSRSKWDGILEVWDGTDLVTRDWLKLIEDSKWLAQRDFELLIEQMVELGWACKNILLSTKEQVRYSFVDDYNSTNFNR